MARDLRREESRPRHGSTRRKRIRRGSRAKWPKKGKKPFSSRAGKGKAARGNAPRHAAGKKKGPHSLGQEKKKKRRRKVDKKGKIRREKASLGQNDLQRRNKGIALVPQLDPQRAVAWGKKRHRRQRRLREEKKERSFLSKAPERERSIKPLSRVKSVPLNCSKL